MEYMRTGTFDEHGRPYVNVWVSAEGNGNYRNATLLVDTGADHCHLPKEFLEMIGAVPSDKIEVDVHGGGTVKSHIYRITIKIEEDGTAEPCQAQGIDCGAIGSSNATSSGVIGMSFLKFFQLSIRYGESISLSWGGRNAT